MALHPAASATVSRIEPGQHDRALDTLVLAFAGDPVERWLWPSGEAYLAHFPRFLEAFGGAAFSHGTAWQADDHQAVALWIPPDATTNDEAIVASLIETTDPSLHANLLSVLDQMGAAHPHDPHWYLPWFGVDPARQSQGLGSVLIRACLDTVDADGLPAYLETPNPRNISFYERHGFVVVGVMQGDQCPPVTAMRRPAR